MAAEQPKPESMIMFQLGTIQPKVQHLSPTDYSGKRAKCNLDIGTNWLLEVFNFGQTVSIMFREALQPDKARGKTFLTDNHFNSMRMHLYQKWE